MRLLLYKVYQIVLRMIAFLFGGKAYRKIVVVGSARTGSNLLLSYLNSHRHVEVKGELFGYLEGKTCDEIWNSTFRKKVPWIKWFGFKIFHEQPLDSQDTQVWNFIRDDKGILIIHINRINTLRTYLSHQIASQTGSWTQIYSEKPLIPADKRISLDLGNLLTKLEAMELADKAALSQFTMHKYCQVSYEQLVDNPQGEMEKVFHQMDLKIGKVQTKLVKQNPEPLKELVSNYADLTEALKGTKYERFLED